MAQLTVLWLVSAVPYLTLLLQDLTSQVVAAIALAGLVFPLSLNRRIPGQWAASKKGRPVESRVTWVIHPAYVRYVLRDTDGIPPGVFNALRLVTFFSYPVVGLIVQGWS
ncbi:MAG TPA: hypothetical protein VF163_21165 [Micromonosporaceae bacterium]